MNDTPILMKQYGVDVVALFFAVGGAAGTLFGVVVGISISLLIVKFCWRWVMRWLVASSVSGDGGK